MNDFNEIIKANYTADELIELYAVEAEAIFDRCYSVSKTNVDRLVDWSLAKEIQPEAIADALRDAADELDDLFGDDDDD